MRREAILSTLLKAAAFGVALGLVLVWLLPGRFNPLLREPVEIREVSQDRTPTTTEAAPAVGSGVPDRQQGPVSYAAAVERAAPAVVNINTAKVVVERQHPFFDDPVFREFFGGDLIRPRRRVETSLGSGVIVSPDGYILTNHHVIRGADAIQVSLRDGRTAQARVVGSDPETDLAVLKVELEKLPAITLGQSDRLRVGDVVLAIGNPFGVGQTVTMGIVSATGRSRLGINTFENFIQTDAAINPGNSGGALIDAEGHLVGINTAIFTRSGGSQGIGFAIPTSLAKGVLEDIIRYGRPRRGWIGIEAYDITPEMARGLGLETNEGVIVAAVVRGGPAHRAGLVPGDIIRRIDGKPIRESRDALLAISSHRPGERLTIEYVRDGKTQRVEVTTIERPVRRTATE
jgi:Do/DeqQ family serine protease